MLVTVEMLVVADAPQVTIGGSHVVEHLSTWRFELTPVGLMLRVVVQITLQLLTVRAEQEEEDDEDERDVVDADPEDGVADFLLQGSLSGSYCFIASFKAFRFTSSSATPSITPRTSWVRILPRESPIFSTACTGFLTVLPMMWKGQKRLRRCSHSGSFCSG